MELTEYIKPAHLTYDNPLREYLGSYYSLSELRSLTKGMKAVLIPTSTLYRHETPVLDQALLDLIDLDEPLILSLASDRKANTYVLVDGPFQLAKHRALKKPWLKAYVLTPEQILRLNSVDPDIQ